MIDIKDTAIILLIQIGAECLYEDCYGLTAVFGSIQSYQIFTFKTSLVYNKHTIYDTHTRKTEIIRKSFIYPEFLKALHVYSVERVIEE